MVLYYIYTYIYRDNIYITIISYILIGIGLLPICIIILFYGPVAPCGIIFGCIISLPIFEKILHIINDSIILLILS